MTKIIYYYQTFCGLENILELKNNIVTHIHLSSIHFGVNDDGTKYIHLNDYNPYNAIFDSVWKDVEIANTKGIKIILMVGGAGGAYNELFTPLNI